MGKMSSFGRGPPFVRISPMDVDMFSTKVMGSVILSMGPTMIMCVLPSLLSLWLPTMKTLVCVLVRLCSLIDLVAPPPLYPQLADRHIEFVMGANLD